MSIAPLNSVSFKANTAPAQPQNQEKGIDYLKWGGVTAGLGTTAAATFIKSAPADVEYEALKDDAKAAKELEITNLEKELTDINAKGSAVVTAKVEEYGTIDKKIKATEEALKKDDADKPTLNKKLEDQKALKETGGDAEKIKNLLADEVQGKIDGAKKALAGEAPDEVKKSAWAFLRGEEGFSAGLKKVSTAKKVAFVAGLVVACLALFKDSIFGSKEA